MYVPRIDHRWDADLMDMASISKYNDGYHYVLLAIDIFSRYVWTVPLKTKQGTDSKKGNLCISEQIKEQSLRILKLLVSLKISRYIIL